MNPPPRLRVYFLTWVALMALLATTLGSAFVPLGNWNVTINLAVAAAKALLIAAFFMHLRYAGSLMRIAAVTGLVIFALLPLLSGPDYFTRQPTPAPGAPPSAR